MKTYAADKAAAGAAGGAAAGSSEWVFGLLGTRRYRDRLAVLAGAGLRRRPDCEPCLRSLVVDEWTPETQHHLGWCESCRGAGLAIGMAAAASPVHKNGRRAALVALAAAAAIAAPLVASQVIDNPLSEQPLRGGSSHTVKPPVDPVARSKGAGGVKPAAQGTHKDPAKATGADASAHAGSRGHGALPLTT